MYMLATKHQIETKEAVAVEIGWTASKCVGDGVRTQRAYLAAHTCTELLLVQSSYPR